MPVEYSTGSFGRPYVKLTYAAIVIWMGLFIWGGKGAIRESFIPGEVAENLVNFVLPALVATAGFGLVFFVRRKKIRLGESVPNSSSIKLVGATLLGFVLIYAMVFVGNYLGVVYCIAYLGEAFPGTPVTHNAEIISERGLKPYSGDLALAHVDLLDEHRSANFAWSKREIRNLMACPGGRISISGSGTVFGTVVQSVQCSPTPS